MTDHIHQHLFEPFLESRRSFILLRWLLIILVSYLVFAGGRNGEVGVEALFVIAAFFLSNLVLGLLPAAAMEFARSHNIVVVADGVLISACFYLLRVDGPAIHIAYIAIFLVALIWTNLQMIMFSLLISSILFGAFSFFGVYRFDTQVPTGEFLSLSLLFVVSVLYVFLSSRFDRDSATATVMIEERKISEIMVEMTRTLAASMNSEDVYGVVVEGLSGAMPGGRFAVARVVDGSVLFEARSWGEKDQAPMPLEEHPSLRRAYEEKKTVVSTEAGRAEAVVPMITQGEVIGLLWCRGEDGRGGFQAISFHLFEVVASTAANALRNVRLLEEMKHIARTDFLTGLPNHRYFQQTLKSEMGRAERHERPLSLLVVDLDFLKSVNDRFGHPAGDAVIRSVAEAIRSACREIDFPARYGGEEFVVILPDTDLTGAVEVAERLRRLVHDTDVGPEVGQITASIGVANYPINALAAQDLVWVADQALYVAKNGGRNQVAHFKYELTSQ